jgi:hypothetical protein
MKCCVLAVARASPRQKAINDCAYLFTINGAWLSWRSSGHHWLLRSL